MTRPARHVSSFLYHDMKQKFNQTGKTTADIITDETRALIAATANVADRKVVDARNRLSAALTGARETYNNVKNKATGGMQATDRAVRGNPYGFLAAVFGIGLIVGFICRGGKSSQIET